MCPIVFLISLELRLLNDFHWLLYEFTTLITIAIAVGKVIDLGAWVKGRSVAHVERVVLVG